MPFSFDKCVLSKFQNNRFNKLLITKICIIYLFFYYDKYEIITAKGWKKLQ